MTAVLLRYAAYALILGVAAGVPFAAVRALRHSAGHGQHAIPRSYGVTPVPAAGLAPLPPWAPAQRPEHVAGSMMPEPGPPLAPLPDKPGAPGWCLAFHDDNPVGNSVTSNDASGNDAGDADQAHEEARALSQPETAAGDDAARSRYAELVERDERLFPRWQVEIWELMHHHPDSESAVESMFTRAQAAQVRALTNGQASHG